MITQGIDDKDTGSENKDVIKPAEVLPSAEGAEKDLTKPAETLPSTTEEKTTLGEEATESLEKPTSSLSVDKPEEDLSVAANKPKVIGEERPMEGEAEKINPVTAPEDEEDIKPAAELSQDKQNSVGALFEGEKKDGEGIPQVKEETGKVGTGAIDSIVKPEAKIEPPKDESLTSSLESVPDLKSGEIDQGAVKDSSTVTLGDQMKTEEEKPKEGEVENVAANKTETSEPAPAQPPQAEKPAIPAVMPTVGAESGATEIKASEVAAQPSAEGEQPKKRSKAVTMIILILLLVILGGLIYWVQITYGFKNLI